MTARIEPRGIAWWSTPGPYEGVPGPVKDEVELSEGEEREDEEIEEEPYRPSEEPPGDR